MHRCCQAITEVDTGCSFGWQSPSVADNPAMGAGCERNRNETDLGSKPTKRIHKLKKKLLANMAIFGESKGKMTRSATIFDGRMKIMMSNDSQPSISCCAPFASRRDTLQNQVWPTKVDPRSQSCHQYDCSVKISYKITCKWQHTSTEKSDNMQRFDGSNLPFIIYLHQFYTNTRSPDSTPQRDSPQGRRESKRHQQYCSRRCSLAKKNKALSH